MSSSDAAMMAFQASGAVINYFQNVESKRMIEIGRQLEQSAFETNLEAIRLQAAESSLEAMKKLRHTIGSQIAVQAARGTRTGVGSALGIQEASFRGFSEDERIRKLNLLMGETSLRSGHTMSELKAIQQKSALDKDLFNKVFQTVANRGNIESAQQIGSSFGFGTAASAGA